MSKLVSLCISAVALPATGLIREEPSALRHPHYPRAELVLGKATKSQSGEDRALYEQFFDGIRGGTFVEMGALDGITYSNTFAYEKVLGWKGLLIEANPVSCERLRMNRGGPGVIPICTAITNTSDFVEFEEGVHAAVFASVNKMSPQFRKKWHGQIAKKVKVPSVPLWKLLSMHGISSIDLFSLDVEGSEMQVLESMDWSIPVKVWCIEVQRHLEQSISSIMQRHGYRRTQWLYEDGMGASRNQLFIPAHHQAVALSLTQSRSAFIEGCCSNCSSCRFRRWCLVQPGLALPFYASQPTATHLVRKMVHMSHNPGGAGVVWREFCHLNQVKPTTKMAHVAFLPWDATSDAATIQHSMDLFDKGKLIQIRLGNVESWHLACATLNFNCELRSKTTAEYMQSNAGWFSTDKAMEPYVFSWWVNETLQGIRASSRPLLAGVSLSVDLLIWGSIGLKGPFILWKSEGYEALMHHILQSSDDKEILFIGAATRSFRLALERPSGGLQSYYTFRVSNFSWKLVHLPQTAGEPSTGVYRSSIDVIQATLHQVRRAAPNFDTAVLACGAYAMPLINILRKHYPGRNLLQLSSAVYDFFGINTRSKNFSQSPPKMNKQGIALTRPENAIDAAEKYVPSLHASIDHGKYWA